MRKFNDHMAKLHYLTTIGECYNTFQNFIAHFKQNFAICEGLIIIM